MTIPSPAALLSGCTVIQSATIFYPLDKVPDLERHQRRPIRPRQVKVHAVKTNNGPWELHSPTVLGGEVLKNGAVGLAEREHAVYRDAPEWLAEVVASIAAALNGVDG